MTSPSPSDQDRAVCDCGHLKVVHSREAGVGCLHSITNPRLLRVLELVDDDGTCECLRAGTSMADQ